jgi:hypothetical protein
MTELLRARPDRRNPNRLLTPVCPVCSTDREVVAIIRTSKFVYFRCHQCRTLVTKAMPVVLSRRFVARLSVEH